MVEGRRDRRRRELRGRVVGAAMELFLARGFDAVTVAEIAERADVAEKTVFNHFPAKSDLVFGPGEDLVAELVGRIRDRPPGQPVIDAVQQFRLTPSTPGRPDGPTREFLDLIEASPALRDRRRAEFARWEAVLAEELRIATGERPGSVVPFVAAAALMAVLRAPFELAVPDRGHHGALAALDLLRNGLGGYAPAAPDTTSPGGEPGPGLPERES